MLQIDHVIAVVADLETAAELLWQQHGLASVAGGRHPGHGTGNRIIPFGPDYLELMAVVDPAEASASPLGRWASASRHPGVVPAALCLRTDDITVVTKHLGEEPLAMSRRTPDGRELRWHLAGLDGMLERGAPFFISWHCDPRDHPGAAEVRHRQPVTGIQSVTTSMPGALAELLEAVPGLSPQEAAGVATVIVGTDTGEIRLGSDT